MLTASTSRSTPSKKGPFTFSGYVNSQEWRLGSEVHRKDPEARELTIGSSLTITCKDVAKNRLAQCLVTADLHGAIMSEQSDFQAITLTAISEIQSTSSAEMPGNSESQLKGSPYVTKTWCSIGCFFDLSRLTMLVAG
ncbi:hypothetical protein L3X38_034519 [Prunus dulcis]|uniref:Uncharacterized protein n=1 Tax=Prunus dulcis TaxID=3755 RepID=A0AAD4VI00_PRUDU|nr:hypothetical protein L3X38_034519 [Prunus dulcis]